MALYVIKYIVRVVEEYVGKKNIRVLTRFVSSGSNCFMEEITIG